MGNINSKNNDLNKQKDLQYIVEDGIVFALNENNLTASVAKTFETNEDIFIKRHIKYNYHNYLIININGGSFKYNNTVRSITFPEDSELFSIGSNAFIWSSLESIQIPPKVTKIGENAFYQCKKLKSVFFSEKSQILSIDKNIFSNSSIESINIPPKIEEFQEGWCKGLEKLKKISISPLNKNFQTIDDKIIIGKTNKEQAQFNRIIFASRDIKNVNIPSNIEKIDSFSFSNCNSIESIEFSEDSRLTKIGSEAFSYSSIEQINIPSTVTEISEGAFIYCHNLKSVFFNENSQMKSIGKYVFANSSLESINIPKNIVEFQEGWCIGLSKLNKISISPLNHNFQYINDHIIIGKLNENENQFKKIIFARRDIKSATIPSHIEQIGPLSFSNCNSIESIQFSSNSNLTSIEKQAFARSSIRFISIPKKCKKVGEHAFSLCKRLRSVKFEDDSKLFLIDESA